MPQGPAAFRTLGVACLSRDARTGIRPARAHRQVEQPRAARILRAYSFRNLMMHGPSTNKSTSGRRGRRGLVEGFQDFEREFVESRFVMLDMATRPNGQIEEQRGRSLEESTTGATKRSWAPLHRGAGSMDSGGVTSQTTGSKASRFAFLRSFSTKGSQALLGQQNSLVSLDSYAFPTHEKSVTLSAATTRSKMAAMKLQASEGDGDEDALLPCLIVPFRRRA